MQVTALLITADLNTICVWSPVAVSIIIAGVKKKHNNQCKNNLPWSRWQCHGWSCHRRCRQEQGCAWWGRTCLKRVMRPDFFNDISGIIMHWWINLHRRRSGNQEHRHHAQQMRRCSQGESWGKLLCYHFWQKVTCSPWKVHICPKDQLLVFVVGLQLARLEKLSYAKFEPWPWMSFQGGSTQQP